MVIQLLQQPFFLLAARSSDCYENSLDILIEPDVARAVEFFEVIVDWLAPPRLDMIESSF